MKLCPKCGFILVKIALVDSDQRPWSSWLRCEECGWDQRKDYGDWLKRKFK